MLEFLLKSIGPTLMTIGFGGMLIILFNTTNAGRHFKFKERFKAFFKSRKDKPKSSNKKARYQVISNQRVRSPKEIFISKITPIILISFCALSIFTIGILFVDNNRQTILIRQLEISRLIDLKFYGEEKLLERLKIDENNVYIAMTHATMSGGDLVELDETVNELKTEVHRIIEDANVHVYFFNKEHDPMFYTNGGWAQTTFKDLKKSFN